MKFDNVILSSVIKQCKPVLDTKKLFWCLWVCVVALTDENIKWVWTSGETELRNTKWRLILHIVVLVFRATFF
jgi:hypothetical protein